jgi:two-component system, cell cycle sensor histidine kinase and response regulator CckA
MFKNAQSEINNGPGMYYEKTNTSVDWTLLNQWNELKGVIPKRKKSERDVCWSDPTATKAVEQVALSFAGFFRSVMKHAAVLEEEIGKQALEQFHLGRIQDSCTHGVNLIYRLMILSGKMPTKMEQFDLNDIIRSIDTLIPRIMRDNITVEIDIAEDDLPMMGDLRFMKQAIAELILNANEALPSGGTITLATRKTRPRWNAPDLDSEKTFSCALLSVTDSGSGINDDTRRHMFKPFFSTKPKEMSLGLGLPLVEKIIRAHNGTLNITSRNQEGTSVRVYLPLLKLQENTEEMGPNHVV